MKFHLLFYLIFKILIIHVLSQNGGSSPNQGDSLKVDLEKYKKTTVPYYKNYIVFDSSDFKKDEKIYFKITASRFLYDQIDFEFFDNLQNFTSINPRYTTSTSKSDDDDVEIRYYTIEKASSNLGSSEGKYLIIYFYCEGDVEIENLDRTYDTLITIIIIIIVIIVAIIVLIWYFCKRRKYTLINNNMLPTGVQANYNTGNINYGQVQTNANNYYNQGYINNGQVPNNVNNYNQGYNNQNNQNTNYNNNNNKTKKKKKIAKIIWDT